MTTVAERQLAPESILAGTQAGAIWRDLLVRILADRSSRFVFIASAVVAGFVYSLLLPFAYTQRFSIANWQYLDARYIFFTVAFALGIAWLVTLQVFAVRSIGRGSTGKDTARRSGPLGGLAAAASFLPSLLCCSPIVPTLVGILPVSVATRLHTTGRVTYFFATKENLILASALVVLAASGLWSLRRLARSACLASQCCVPGTAAGESGDSHEPATLASTIAKTGPAQEKESIS